MGLEQRYAKVREHAEQAREIVPKGRAALIARTALESEEIFGDRVPCSTARSIEDMFDHAPVQAEVLVAIFRSSGGRRCQGFANPVIFSSTPGPHRFVAPPR